MRRKFFGAVTLLLSVTGAFAFEQLNETDTPNYGIPVVSMSESRWKSKMIASPDRLTAKERIWSGEDFFTGEYGNPCIFTEDWIKKYGYATGGDYKIENGELVFTGGSKGFAFGFGQEPGKYSAPAIRFGFNWGAQMKDLYRLRVEIEQNQDKTEWEFTTNTSYDKTKKKFEIKGKGLQTFEIDLGMVREASRQYPVGIQFNCLTPGATVKIKSIKIATSSAEVFFRKTFELAENPVSAHCTFSDAVNYELYVNGQKVSAGTNVYPSGYIKSIDLKPYLQKGRNVIAYGKQFIYWAMGSPEWLFEAVAVDRNGNVTPIIGDTSWKTSIVKAEGWMKPDFNDSAWKNALTSSVKGSQMLKGEQAFNGINPKHMGILSTEPLGRKYPIFDAAETVKFKALLPAGVKGRYELSLDVCKGGTNDVVEKVSGDKFKDNGDFITGIFTLKVCEPGAYRLIWTLKDQAGKEIETMRGEAVIAGPVKQDEIAYSDYDREFEKRLKLVRKIDCSLPASNDNGEFLDHAGMYSAAAVNKGKVVEKDGMKYRDTGSGRWDYFSYRLHMRERGEPYLAEIIVPDNAPRYIYSGVVETYMLSFCNNLPGMARGWFTASGTCVTGVRNPLTNEKRKLRYIFYPSSFTSSIVVMSGFSGFPAAACEINIYKIEGGLPALKQPATDRMFGSHNERLSTMTLTLGMSEQPLMHDKSIRMAPHDDVWFHWYKTFERKIKLLRSQGYNMSVEGMYMYAEGEYPSAKHCPSISDDQVDPVLLMIKMYSRNKIKTMLGVEYFMSPQVYVNNKAGISERRMWKGERSTRLVDRKGRQLFGYMNGGCNFLDPDIGGYMLDCVSELYKRYESAGEVAGIFMVNGFWWMPTFNTCAYPDMTDNEVGYDDCTVGLFEQETGINLKIDPKDEKRFEKRYELIKTGYMPVWLNWRAKKMRGFIDEIIKTVQSGKTKWKLYQYPQTAPEKKNNPFLEPKSFREERDTYMERHFKESGIPLNLYKSSDSASITTPLMYWAKFATPNENYDGVYGWNFNSGSKKITSDIGTAYLGGCGGLDEVDSPAGAAKKWIFKQTARGVFTVRGVEDNAMNEFVETVMLDKVPKVIFDQWLDCNLETGFGAQLRRFATSFYATPDLKFAQLPEKNVKGVFAQSATYKDGSVCLRLINNTPYASSGYFTADVEKVYDMVYDSDISGGRYGVSLKPNDIRIFRLSGLKDAVKCEFNFSAAAAGTIIRQAEFITKNDFLLNKVPGDMTARMFKALACKDAFELYNIINDFEVISNVRQAKTAIIALDNQAMLLNDLETKGCGRINCGADTVYTDPSGNRWLPDQEYKGWNAYGNISGNAVNRGNIEIQETDKPNIYRTEIWGAHMFYKIPVPDGKYNVKLHFAETFIDNKAPNARFFSVKVCGKMVHEKVDIFASAGGIFKPYILELKDAEVYEKEIIIELTGNACINGIEIEKCAR
jgi:hypothetical protein